MRFAPFVAIALACTPLLVACERATPAVVQGAVDDFGDTVATAGAPRRIVSLNPSTTELLYAIGAGDRMVGRTAYDVWPEAARKLPDLGPGLRPNVEAVLAAKPDLVVLYASDDNRDAARRLRAAGVATAAYRVDRIADFIRVTRALGILTRDTTAARITTDSVGASLERVRASTRALVAPTVFWPLYDQPLLAVGGGSYLDELIAIAGGRNLYGFMSAPSPQITIEDLVQRDPQIVLVSPASRDRFIADPRLRALRAVREGRVLAVDTALVLRPGPRLGEAARSLAALLHPDLAH